MYLLILMSFPLSLPVTGNYFTCLLVLTVLLSCRFFFKFVCVCVCVGVHRCLINTVFTSVYCLLYLLTYLSRKALSVEEVLRTLGVLTPKMKADLFQPVAVTQRTPGDVYQVGFVRPQGHMLSCVVHSASHLQRNTQAVSYVLANASMVDKDDFH